jgi:UDP-N-acetylmuramate--alanine ligase
MSAVELSSIISRKQHVYFIGIKGTGMCALAELFHSQGVAVSGADINDVFYTDAILQELRIPYHESFDAAHIRDDFALVIHSAAYEAASNAEVAETERRGLPLLKYTEALGAYSALFDSSGITGVHGKTTTTALAGTMLAAAGLPAQVLAGSAVSTFGGRSTLNMGNTYFVAETCEYRRHFLSFHPRRIVLTSVESDHQDYYPTYESIRDAFVEYGQNLKPGGALIYCADDAGASEAAALIFSKRQDIALIPYGFTAHGPYRITGYTVADEAARFTLAGTAGAFTLRVPGRHTALNTAAAFALTSAIAEKEGGLDAGQIERIRLNIAAFRGSKRRSEITGVKDGVIFMDDYAHHPTALKTTLAGLRAFYPRRRIIASFMSHTYTRTAALLPEFAASFGECDVLFLHKIYASAREVYAGGVNGKTLFEETKKFSNEVYYIDEPLDAVPVIKSILRPGDLFITLGAGDNWKLGVGVGGV